MPITTGLPAARKWLCLMMALVFFEACWVFPSIRLLDFDFGPRGSTWFYFAAAFSTAVVWTFLALMMVGIETAGVTVVSRYRKQPIDLSNAAKVTCYASTLLFFWVIMGILQVDALYWWAEIYKGIGRYGPRVDSIVTVATFGVAHIAGLIWFEFTVYRGLRAVMYAIR